MEEYAEITQRIDCVFGHDHQITVKINDDRTLGTVFSTCSADKAETDGLILLGTDPMKTCFGYMGKFLEHVNGNMSIYDMPAVYKGTVLAIVAGPLKAEVDSKKRDRQILKQQEENRKNKAGEEGMVARRLRDFMKPHLGRRHEAFTIVQEEDGHYTFNYTKDKRYDHSNGCYIAGGYDPIADRVDGVWVVRHNWEQGGQIYNITGSWGGECKTCQLHGHRHHDDTAGHKRKFAQAAFIGMQATSKEGIRIAKHDIRDKDGDPIRFNYRKNSRKLVGVTIAPEPIPEPPPPPIDLTSFSDQEKEDYWREAETTNPSY